MAHLLEIRGPQETTSKTYSPVAASCAGKLLPSPPERGGIGANSVQGTLLKQLLFYDLRAQLNTCQALPAKEQGLTPVAWPQPPEDLGCQEQKSWQWNSYAILPGTTCACTASPCSIKGCCQQHRRWHQLVATADAINVSKPKSPGKPQPGKSLLLLGREPIPRNAQQSVLQLTLQSTVLRICRSESLLRASAGFGWATMCWRLDLAIAFLEDTRGLAIRSGEEEYVQSTTCF